MPFSRRLRLPALALLAATAIFALAQQAHRVDDKALRDSGKDGEWLNNAADYAETRFSPLKQIDTGNVSRLGLAWYYDTNAEAGNLEATPIEWNGTLYATSTWSVVYALDARTGKEKWRYEPKIGRRNFPAGADGLPDFNAARTGPSPCCGPVNRGVAIYDGKIYVGQFDGKLTALDANTGKVVWSVQTTPADSDFTVTGAPRIVKGKVIIGNGGAEFGVRGYVTAYDAETGKQAWRFYLVPGDPHKPYESKAMADAAKTWTGDNYYKMGGGGTAWDSFTYDPEFDLLYIGTGNGGPYTLKVRSPGPGNHDNLYLSSIVAVKPETGQYVWHFQETPGDEWDYTAVQQMTLADLVIDGKPRKVIMQAPKNGFFYVLDRATGQFLTAAPIAKLTWATGIDAKTGRPTLAPNARYDEKGTWLAPSGGGIHSWHGMSFNPATGLVYIPGGTSVEWYEADPDFKFVAGRVNSAQLRNHPIYGVRPASQPGPKETPDLAKLPGIGDYVGSFLVAWNPVTQKEHWRIPAMNGGGTFTTAGNLVFAASNSGMFTAFSADKGEQLWQVQLLPGMGNPSTYMLDGKQYVTVLAGVAGKGRLYTFMLDGKAAMPQPVRVSGRSTQSGIYNGPQAARGQQLYTQRCAACHMADLSGSGDAPSLNGERFAQAWDGHSVADLFALMRSTMPKGAAGSLTAEQYADVLAYLLKSNNDPPGPQELSADPEVLKAIGIEQGNRSERPH